MGRRPASLDLSETWTCTCKTRLYETTRNTATATGKWSQATGRSEQQPGDQQGRRDRRCHHSRLTVVKSAVPENGTPFDYTASGAGLHPTIRRSRWHLGTRRATAAARWWWNHAGGTEYTIDEQTTAGWSLEDITCEGAQSETTTPSTGEAKVTVKPGDTATCNTATSGSGL